MSRYRITSTRTWSATHTVHAGERKESGQIVRDMDNAEYYDGVTSEVTHIATIDTVVLDLNAWRVAVAAGNTQLGFIEWRTLHTK